MLVGRPFQAVDALLVGPEGLDLHGHRAAPTSRKMPNSRMIAETIFRNFASGTHRSIRSPMNVPTTVPKVVAATKNFAFG